MIVVNIKAAFAGFRSSYSRSHADTYPVAPPSTVYGLLLSLSGEHNRGRHEGAELAFAYERIPQQSTNLRVLNRYKYGIPYKQKRSGGIPTLVDVLSDISLFCWIDGSNELHSTQPKLCERVREALLHPESVERTGLVCLGSSDDIVDEVSLVDKVTVDLYRLIPKSEGILHLPVWVDHVGSKDTRWQSYELDENPVRATAPDDSWTWTRIGRVSP